MALDFENSQTVSHGETDLLITQYAIGVNDATVLRGIQYRNPNPSKKTNRLPVFCIPSELGNASEFESLALEIMSAESGPEVVYAISLRGRGLSDKDSVENYSPLIAADDIVNVCDALGLHHIAVIANAGGVLPAMLMAAKRPSLIAKMVMNDGTPEKDGVGIARLRTLSKNHPNAKTLGDAIKRERSMLGSMFPDFSDADWAQKVGELWNSDDETAYDPALLDLSDVAELEEKQPTLWPEFRLLALRPVLLVRGENSLIVTDEVAGKMKKVAPTLVDVIADGQGHFPLLTKGGLSHTLTDFLSQ